MKSIARMLLVVISLSWMNFPWEALAASYDPAKEGSWLLTQKLLVEAVAPQSFEAAYAQVKGTESQAVDAMAAELPYRLKNQYLMQLIIDRMMLTGIYEKFPDGANAGSANDRISPNSTRSTGTASVPTRDTPARETLPDSRSSKHNYVPKGVTAPKGIAASLGFPKEADDDPVLVKMLEILDKEGKAWKPYREKREQIETKLTVLLASLLSLAKTDDEKSTALGADASVSIRRFAGWPMHSIIPKLKDDPICAGDLFKDGQLFSQVDALAAGNKNNIVKGYQAVQGTLRCADLVQTIGLDRGVALAWIRLHENFGDAKYDLPRKRIREWLFQLAMLMGDVHQSFGLTGSQALVQLLGNTSLVGPGSWLVRDGFFSYNVITGNLNHFPIREEVYVEKPSKPVEVAFNIGTPTAADDLKNMEMTATQLEQLNSGIAAGNLIEQKPAPLDLSMYTPFEYLDLTTPFGYAFRDLQESCKLHAAIKPTEFIQSQTLAGGRPILLKDLRYSITDFITISAFDRVGVGLCSKQDMLALGGYCKKMVCDNPNVIDLPFQDESPGNITVKSCSLPMPGSEGAECSLINQTSKNIHALATANESCPVNPWREDTQAAGTPKPDTSEPSTPNDNEPDTDKDKDPKKENNGRPPGVPADAKEWDCDWEGCGWSGSAQGMGWSEHPGGPKDKNFMSAGNGDPPSAASGGTAGTGSGSGGGVPAAAGSGSGSGAGSGSGGGVPAAAGSGSGGGSGSGSGGGGMPAAGDSGSGNGNGSSAAGTGNATKEVSQIDPNEWTGTFGESNSVGGLTVPSATGSPASKIKSLFKSIGSKANHNLMEFMKRQFRNVVKRKGFWQFMKPGSGGGLDDSDIQDLHKLMVADIEANVLPLTKMSELTNLVISIVGEIKTFKDVDVALTSLIKIDDYLDKLIAENALIDQKSRVFFYSNQLRRQLEKSPVYKIYIREIQKQAITVMKNPKFRAAVRHAFGLSRAVGPNGPKFNELFDAAYGVVTSGYVTTAFSVERGPKGGPLGTASPDGHVIGDYSIPVDIKQSLHGTGSNSIRAGIPVRKILLNVQIHENLHLVSFGLDHGGYLAPGPIKGGSVGDKQFETRDHDVIFVISMLTGVSLEHEQSVIALGGYHGADPYLPGGQFGGTSGSGSSGNSQGQNSTQSPAKDCPPGQPCGGCQPVSQAAAMAAKCSMLKPLKLPNDKLTPDPQGGGSAKKDPLTAFFECQAGGPDANSGGAADSCPTTACGQGSQAVKDKVKGTCGCKPIGSGSGNAIDGLDPKNFMGQCAAIQCVDGSTHPCCAGSNTAKQQRASQPVDNPANMRNVPAAPAVPSTPPVPAPKPNSPAIQTRTASPAATANKPVIDTRKYTPYKEPARSAPTPAPNPRSNYNPYKR